MSESEAAGRILGYCDRISVRPGDVVRFMLSTPPPLGPLQTGVVRIFCATDHPAGPGLRLVPIASDADGFIPAREQPIRLGSNVVVDATAAVVRASSFSLGLFVWPTLPGRGRQVLASRWSDTTRAGFALCLDESGGLAFRLGDGSGATGAVSTGRPLLAREWYFVAASYDAATGAVCLLQEPLQEHPFAADAASVTGEASIAPWPQEGAPLVFASWREAGDVRAATGEHFNGKIARPRLLSKALPAQALGDLRIDPLPATLAPWLVGDWDLSRSIPGDAIEDVSGNGLHGRAVNGPTRGVTGPNWIGRSLDWTVTPEEYGAIHFHDDDLTDCCWDADVTVPVGDWPSGLYALRVTAADGSTAEFLPFYVRAPKGGATAQALYLASTATYLAYTNLHRFHRSVSEPIAGKLIVMTAEDLYLNAHPELGLSTYDTHGDGSGVVYSSRLRPDLENRVRGRLWNFSLDTLLLDWLDRMGEGVDVATDEDLHREGASLLAPYRVVLTGSHPEYYSLAMLDALEAHTRQGGRLMYLGGNGFYWRIAWHPTTPGILENRRALGGTRTFATPPEESRLSFSGESGGTWRSQGRAPQKIAGVGFAAQGFNSSTWFVRQADAKNPRAAFVFDDVAEGPIGYYGLGDGGAAGIEIDRFERDLGSPAHALVLASSTGHTSDYRLATEEMLVNDGMTDGTNSENVRADMVFFETPRGGAVFSTGSIAWIAALPHNGYDNDVAQITLNVLRRFLDPEPFIPTDVPDRMEPDRRSG